MLFKKILHSFLKLALNYEKRVTLTEQTRKPCIRERMRVRRCIWMDDASLNRIKRHEISFSFYSLTRSLTRKAWRPHFHLKILFLTHLAWKIHPFYVFNGNSFVSTQTRWQHYRYWLMLVLCFHKLRENKKKSVE